MILLDYRDKRPIYEQVVEKLERLIASGGLEPLTKMPSVRSLAVELSVNPGTVQRAYAQLEQDGLAKADRTAGRLVTQDAAALEAILTGAGANGFLWQARAPGGQLNYTSALAPAGSVAAGARDAASLQALCAGEDVVAAARFACFHDNVYAFDKANMQPAGICQRNGYIWYDNHNGHWLDPEKEQARAYVISLAVECAQLGFDELVLEEMHYPKTGRLQKIDYSGSQMAKPDALALFLTELREALEPYGTRISLLLSQELLAAGKDEASGEDLAALLPLVDAVYVATGDIPGTQALLTAIAGEEAPALVPLTAAPTAGNWCVSAG